MRSVELAEGQERWTASCVGARASYGGENGYGDDDDAGSTAAGATGGVKAKRVK
jgi:hypothetical protein